MVLYKCSSTLSTFVILKVLTSFLAIIVKEKKASVSKLILSSRWKTFTFHRFSMWRFHVSHYLFTVSPISRRVALRARIHQIKAVYSPVTGLKRCQMDGEWSRGIVIDWWCETLCGCIGNRTK